MTQLSSLEWPLEELQYFTLGCGFISASPTFFFFCVQLHVTVVSETLLRHAYNRRQRLAFLAPSSFVQ